MLIQRQGIRQRLLAEIVAQHGWRAKIDLPPQQLDQLVLESEMPHSWMSAREVFHQQVDIASGWIEIVPQHRPEKAQLPNTSGTAKRREFLAVDCDRQFRSGHTLTLGIPTQRARSGLSEQTALRGTNRMIGSEKGLKVSGAGSTPGARIPCLCLGCGWLRVNRLPTRAQQSTTGAVATKTPAALQRSRATLARKPS